MELKKIKSNCEHPVDDYIWDNYIRRFVCPNCKATLISEGDKLLTFEPKRHLYGTKTV